MKKRKYKFNYKETVATILTESDDFYKIAVEAILEARSEIERYIAINPYFLISYEPFEDCFGGKVIDEMCKAAKIAKVGPMASVAGAIAGYAVEKMMENGASLAVVENGGDIAMHSDQEILIGLKPTNFAFLIEPKEFYSVCTSSGKISHSVSFGYADAACVFGENAALCDALATALGNGVKESFGKDELKKYAEEFYSEFKKYIDAIFIVKDCFLAYAGKVPEIVLVNDRSSSPDLSVYPL
ncbi:MAG: UPF0280 family protein [Archaeoglobaceae archaeon]|nr:UPF0280 family protein [Archaeoglobaceae archaeon]